MSPARKKSQRLHTLHGSTPHDRAVESESQIAGGFPRVPKDVERARFKRICGQLAKRGTLTPADLEIVRLLCVVSERHERALAKLKAEGEVRIYSRVSPTGESYDVEAPSHWLKVAESAERMTLSCLDRLGLTPASREKIRPTKPDPGANVPQPGEAAFEHPELFGLPPGVEAKPIVVMEAPLSFEAEPEDEQQ